MLAIGWWAHSRVGDSEDFIVAGRRLGFPLAWASLFATWFGAGTILASADEVRATGLRAVAMEPLGAGLCLVVAGLFFAGPLWSHKLLTLADYYHERFGRRAELWFSVGVITYYGWIAAQLVGVAGICEVFFGLPMWAGILIAAAVALVYTLLGGMWSVTLTDAAQIVILLIGLAAVTWAVLAHFGQGDPAVGLGVLEGRVKPELLVLVPTSKFADAVGWLNLLVIGSLGNVAGADLMQRVFSSRSATVAKRACVAAGVAYIVVGVAPAVLGLAASALLPDSVQTAVLPALAKKMLSPGMVVLFVLALMSAILSTLDSAILTASSVLAVNVFRPWVAEEKMSTLTLTRWCAVGTTVGSVALALGGESAFALLQSSYAMSLAGPFVPLVFGLFWSKGNEKAAVTSLVLGYAITGLEMVAPDIVAPLPLPLVALAVSAAAYVGVALATDREAAAT